MDGEEGGAGAVAEVHAEGSVQGAAHALGALGLLASLQHGSTVRLLAEVLDPLGGDGVGEGASGDGGEVVDVVGVATGERLEELDALLDEQAVDAGEEPRPAVGSSESIV